MYGKETEKKVENRLLATHISANAEFESACMSGDGKKIMSIVETEMEKNNLFTKGSQKLKSDIIAMLKGKERVPSWLGQNILMFVWNSRMSGTGYAVIK
jgi:hypothetical protein